MTKQIIITITNFLFSYSNSSAEHRDNYNRLSSKLVTKLKNNQLQVSAIAFGNETNSPKQTANLTRISEAWGVRR